MLRVKSKLLPVSPASWCSEWQHLIFSKFQNLLFFFNRRKPQGIQLDKKTQMFFCTNISTEINGNGLPRIYETDGLLFVRHHCHSQVTRGYRYQSPEINLTFSALPKSPVWPLELWSMLSAAAAPFPWSTRLALALPGLRHVPCGTGVPLPAAPTQLLLRWERPWGRLGTSTGCNHHHHRRHHHLARFQGSSISPKCDVQSENISLRLASSKNISHVGCLIWSTLFRERWEYPSVKPEFSRGFSLVFVVVLFGFVFL